MQSELIIPMSVIHKFKLTQYTPDDTGEEVPPDYLEAEVPVSFELLDLDRIDGAWYIWGWVAEKEEEKKVKMRFVLLMTGQSSNRRFSSGFYRRIKHGPLIGHVFFKERVYV